jgi:Zn-dependent protease
MGDLGIADIQRALMYFLAMLMCLSIHEFSHAFVAYLRGDNTARDQGRMTVNPIAHIDMMGTVVFPIMGALFLGGIIGWAKPVPVDLRNLKSPRLDHLLVSLAGPLSNIVFCFLCVFFLGVAQINGLTPGPDQPSSQLIFELLQTMISVNAILAVFNMIPLPPLDGSAVLLSILPPGISRKVDGFLSPNGFWILMLLFMSGALGFVWSISQELIYLVVGLVQLFLG